MIFDAYGKVEQVMLGKLSVTDGLSQGTINTIFQDQQGYIWLGTENGIDIYDGYKVKHLAGPDGDFSAFAGVMIKQDSQGLMWLNVVGKGLYTLDVTSNQYELIFAKDPFNSEHFIVDVLEGENNQAWIATSKSLILFNKKTKDYQRVVDLSGKLTNLDSIYKINLYKGVIYFATRVGLFAYHIKKEQWKALPLVSEALTSAQAVDFSNASKTYVITTYQDVLYFGTNDGLFSLDIRDIDEYFQQDIILPEYELLIESLSVWQLFQYQDALYISSDKGLSVVNLSDNSSEFLFGLADGSEHITDNTIISLLIDRQGTFWLGSNSLGVFTWNSKRTLVKNYRFKRYGVNSLSNNIVSHVHQQKGDDNTLWVATANGLNRIDLTSGEVKHFLVRTETKSVYNASDIVQIVEDEQQRLWLVTSVGVFLFDIATQKLIDLPFSDQINQRLAGSAYAIYLDEQQRLWYLDDKSLINISLVTGKLDELHELNSQFGKDIIWHILGTLPDSQQLLFSTNNALWQYDTDNQVAKPLYQHPDIAETEWTYIDSWQLLGDTLWLAFSGKGLIGLSAKSYELKHFFHTGNSIIDNNVYGVMADEASNLWFATHQGLFTLNPENLHIRQFTPKHGFAALEYNAGAYTKLQDQRLAYGSMEGVSIFEPIKLLAENTRTGFHVQVTDIEVLSRNLPERLNFASDDTIPLRYDDVGIRIDFSTFSYIHNDNIIYDYRLVGNQAVNYPQTTESHITFPSLPSGTHQLKVRALQPETGEFSDAIYLTFQVSYPPWRSPLAYILYFMLAFSVIAFWYRRRQIQQQLLLDAHEQVKYRENRLQLALTGSNSEVWDWQAENDLMFGKRISSDLGYANEALFYPFAEHLNLIHPDDKELFTSQWRAFIERAKQDENFTCTYRLKSHDDQWLWYKDLGKIVTLNQAGQPIRITGSYTNITETRANEERAQYYGDAFKYTKDWVLIIDEGISKITANQSMRDVFGWQGEEFAFQADILGIDQARLIFYRQLLKSLCYGDSWRGEELITNNDGEQYHVIVNISVGKNNYNQALHYILVLTDISAQKTAEQELRLLANYDHLTGLPNRSLLLERIKHAIDQSERNNRSIALFFIDLDKFKQINDSLGHDYGDLLLKEVTKRLTSVLRQDDTVARIGGDEFVVLLESFSNNNQLSHIAQKVIDSVGKSIVLYNNTVSVGASIGIALYPEDATSSDLLLRNADVAMYHAKQLGRNTFQFFTAQMNVEAKARLEKESKLKLALKNDEFVNYYQPIINAHTGKAVGFELLLRWHAPDGLVTPNNFIPLAEEIGLIVPMTEAALHRGIKALKQWLLHRNDLYLSVNLAAQHFAKDSFVGYVEQLLKEFDLPANALKIEVTESAFISEPEKAISSMRALAELGVTLALDDFGTGFSSLSYLKNLPLDVIKIDRSFVSGIGQSDADEAIVDTTLVLAERLNMHCIAEGVETEQQLQYLVDKGCHYIQGFLYSKPIEETDVLRGIQINKTEVNTTPTL
ncbi:EAL domain-containing protein [Litorilituus sediminis]|uniref:EAL domain-containing protein n=2 Tax=Litorilituus sediminis TaxID=718192 RepID=A0A4P6PBV2_9GAMM|nr:EAL domain-containing protein [Litorilituus sediminis]